MFHKFTYLLWSEQVAMVIFIIGKNIRKNLIKLFNPASQGIHADIIKTGHLRFGVGFDDKFCFCLHGTRHNNRFAGKNNCRASKL